MSCRQVGFVWFKSSVMSLFVFFMMSACASKIISETKKTFQMRSYSEETLANGLKILYVQDSTLPKVRMTAFVRAGAGHDPEGKEGVTALTTRLLDEGTTKRTGPQMAEELAYFGIDYSSSTDQEKTYLSVGCLTPNKEVALQLFSEILMTPSFVEKEVQIKKDQTIAGLQKITENPGGYADILLDQSIFGEHPYGKLVSGNLKSVPGIGRADLVRQYFKYFRPNNAWIAVSGDFDETFRAQVKKVFESWIAAPLPKESFTEIKEVHTAQNSEAIRLVSKSGLQQSQIRIGSLGIRRSDPDFLKLRLASLILGGGFESRLNLKIRDELGLTYSISSHYDSMKEAGSFEISTFSRNDKVAEVLKQTREVLQQFIKGGVTAKELESAKTLLISQFPASVETAGETATNLLRLRFYEIPDTYLTQFMKNVSEITLKDVNEAIRRHLKFEMLRTVVYADQAQVGEALKGLGDLKVEVVNK